ncbi:MAG TPA: hypothetical protein PLI09_01425 [Candidatus Hydrogenedentes bacterium]|nr:hypothetical protein [Candidatus Hydrogenedentota bacterium]
MILKILKALARLAGSAGFDFGLAAVFLITWTAPNTFGALSVHHLVFVMLLEFLVVHSTGFLGAIAARDSSLRQRVLMFSGLMVFYLLMAGGFSALYGGWWPLWAFMGLTLSKIPSVVLHPPDFEGQTVLMANWAAMTVLYLGGAAVTVMMPVPAWGVTKEIIAAQHFGIGGIWPDEPYRVMAFGALYFTGLGLLAIINELIATLWRPRT